MRQYVNAPLLAGLLALGLLSACAAPDRAVMLADARVALAAGDERTAMIHAQNFLKGEPDNIEARLLRADIALELGDGFVAEKDLLRSRELGTPPGDVVVKLGKAMMLQGAFDRVIADIHAGAANGEQARIEILLMRGNAYLGLGNVDSAKRSFTDVAKLDPDSPDAMVGFGRVALANDDIDSALTNLSRAVEAAPDDAGVWQANGEVQLAGGNTEEAKQSFLRALEIEPLIEIRHDNYATLSGLFQAHLTLGEGDEALALVNDALEIEPGHPLLHYLIGRHAVSDGDKEAATDNLLKTITAFPTHVGALSLMGSLSLEEGNLSDAETYLQQALAVDPDNPGLRMQLASTMLRQREGDSALAVLQPALRELGDVPELLALAGRATAASSDGGNWLSFFEQAAAADPGNLRWQFELARAYLTAGLPDKSMAVLKGIPDSDETSDPRDLIMVEALSRQGDTDAALVLGQQLLDRHPDDVEMQINLGRLQLIANQFDAARQQLDAVLDNESGNIRALLLRGQVEIRAENLDEAERYFRSAYTRQPDNLAAVTLLVASARQRGDTQAAIEWFKGARETNPDDVLPLVGLVSLYLGEDDVSQAYETARAAAALKPDDPRALLALGMTQVRREEYQTAVGTLKTAAVKAPQSGMIQFELAKAYAALEKPFDARISFQQAVSLSPWNADYMAAAIRFDLSVGKTEEATTLARQLIAGDADNADGYRLLGQTLIAQKGYDEAAAAFGEAAARGQTDTPVIEQYGALALAGQAQARDVLVAWLDDHADAWRVRLLVAQLHHRKGEISQAIEQYERVLTADPDNVSVLNNLAWAYHGENDNSAALEKAQRVHELRPNVGTYTDTVGWMLTHNGDIEGGLEKIRKAVKQAPSEGEIRYHLAAILAQIGEEEEARLLLTQLVNANEPFDSVSEAKALLAEL